MNNGRPTIAATVRPAVFSGRGVVAATSAGARPTNIAANANRQTNSTRSNSPVNMARATSNLGRPSTSNALANNNGALQNRNAQRDNAFAHSQISPTHTQGSSVANQSSTNRPPSSLPRQRQLSTQRSTLNNAQNNSRQFADRPSYSSAPAQRNVPNNTRGNSRQFASRPSYSSPAQHTNVTRPQPSPAYPKHLARCTAGSEPPVCGPAATCGSVVLRPPLSATVCKWASSAKRSAAIHSAKSAAQ